MKIKIERKARFYKIYAVVVALFCLTCAAESAFGQKNSNKTKPASFKVEVVGRGKPMILIPGLASSGDVWESTVARYKNKYQCHILTLAGFAGQPPIGAPFLETVRQDLAKYIRDKKLKKPVVVGHSLGGFTALWLASKEPDLIGKLIVVDSLPSLPAAQQPNATVETIKPQAEKMRQGMIEQASAQTPEQRRQSQSAILQAMISDPAKIELAARWSEASDPETVAQAFYELYTTDLRSDLANIKAPTLVIGTWIAYRQYATREQVENNFRQQYSKLPGYKFVMADKAKHFVMFDDPDFLFQEADNFLGFNARSKAK